MILFHIVESYLQKKKPISSRFLCKNRGVPFSPATIRNVMADLEDTGFLTSLHTSSGRLPSEKALDLYLKKLLENPQNFFESVCPLENKFSFLDEGGVCTSQGNAIQEKEFFLNEKGKKIFGHMSEFYLKSLSGELSHWSGCASIIIEQQESPSLEKIEFFLLSDGKVLVVLITESGVVKNKIFDSSLAYHYEKKEGNFTNFFFHEQFLKIKFTCPLSLDSISEANNFMKTLVKGRTLEDIFDSLEKSVKDMSLDCFEKNEVLKLAIIGLTGWDVSGWSRVIVEGQSHLFSEIAMKELIELQKIFFVLGQNQHFLKFIRKTFQEDGTKVLFGSHWGVSSASAVMTSYKIPSNQGKGAIGVIGSLYMDYKKIIPMVEYTAELIEKKIEKYLD